MPSILSIITTTILFFFVILISSSSSSSSSSSPSPFSYAQQQDNSNNNNKFSLIPSPKDDPALYNIMYVSCNESKPNRDIPLRNPGSDKTNVLWIRAQDVKECVRRRIPLKIGPNVHVAEISTPYFNEVALCGLEIVDTVVEYYATFFISFFKALCQDSSKGSNVVSFKNFTKRTYQTVFAQQTFVLPASSSTDQRYLAVKDYLTEEEKTNPTAFAQQQVLESVTVQDSHFFDSRGYPDQTSEGIIRFLTLATKSFTFINNEAKALGMNLFLIDSIVLDEIIASNNNLISDDRECPESHCNSPKVVTSWHGYQGKYKVSGIFISRVNTDTHNLIADLFGVEEYTMAVAERQRLSLTIENNNIEIWMKNVNVLISMEILMVYLGGNVRVQNNTARSAKVNTPEESQQEIVEKETKIAGDKDYLRTDGLWLSEIFYGGRIDIVNNNFFMNSLCFMQLLGVQRIKNFTEGLFITNNRLFAVSESVVAFSAVGISIGTDMRNISKIVVENNIINCSMIRGGEPNIFSALSSRSLGSLFMTNTAIQLLRAYDVPLLQITGNIAETYLMAAPAYASAHLFIGVANTMCIFENLETLLIEGNTLTSSGRGAQLSFLGFSPPIYKNGTNLIVENNVVNAIDLVPTPQTFRDTISQFKAVLLAFPEAASLLASFSLQRFIFVAVEIETALYTRLKNNTLLMGNMNLPSEFATLTTIFAYSTTKLPRENSVVELIDNQILVGAANPNHRKYYHQNQQQQQQQHHESSSSSSPPPPSFFKSTLNIFAYGPISGIVSEEENPSVLYGAKSVVIDGNRIISVTTTTTTSAATDANLQFALVPNFAAVVFSSLRIFESFIVRNNVVRAEVVGKTSSSSSSSAPLRINTSSRPAISHYLLSDDSSELNSNSLAFANYRPPVSQFILSYGSNDFSRAAVTTGVVGITIENNDILFDGLVDESSSSILTCIPLFEQDEEKNGKTCFGSANMIKMKGNNFTFKFSGSNNQLQPSLSLINTTSSSASFNQLQFEENRILVSAAFSSSSSSSAPSSQTDCSIVKLEHRHDSRAAASPKFSLSGNEIEFRNCANTHFFLTLSSSSPSEVAITSNSFKSTNTQDKTHVATIELIVDNNNNNNNQNRLFSFDSNEIITDALNQGAFLSLHSSSTSSSSSSIVDIIKDDLKLAFHANSMHFSSPKKIDVSSSPSSDNDDSLELESMKISQEMAIAMSDEVSQMLSSSSSSRSNPLLTINSSKTSRCNEIEFSLSISKEKLQTINPNFEDSVEQPSSLISVIHSTDCQDYNVNTTVVNSTSNNETVTTPTPASPSSSSHSPLLTTGTSATQSIAFATTALGAAVVPSLGLGVARQQAMLDFVQGIRDGDCAGVYSIDGVAAANSPTQMSIGDSESSLFIGGAVGNFILAFSLVVAAQICGTIYLKKTGSSSWNRPFAVFARCHVAMVLYVVASLLFAPTVNFGLTVVALEMPRFVSNVLEKVLAFVFAIVLFAAPVVYYTIWAVFIRERKESYRMIKKNEDKVDEEETKDDANNNKNKSNNSDKKKKKDKEEEDTKTTSTCRGKIEGIFSYWFEGPGEYRMPIKNTKYAKGVIEKHYLEFDAATPMIDGYQGHAYWFGAAEFAIQFGLAFASFLSQVVPSEKSCVTYGVVLVVVLGIFLLLCLYFRPFQERLNRIFVPIVTVAEIVIIAIALYFKENQPDWLVALAMVSASMQSFMAVLVLFASLSPLFKQVLRVYRRLRRITTTSKKKSSSGSRRSDERPRSFFSTVSNPKNLHSLFLGGADRNSDNSSIELVRRKEEVPKRNNVNTNNSSRKDHHHPSSSSPRPRSTREEHNSVDRRQPSARPSSSSTNYKRNDSSASSSSKPRQHDHQSSLRRRDDESNNHNYSSRHSPRYQSPRDEAARRSRGHTSTSNISSNINRQRRNNDDNNDDDSRYQHHHHRNRRTTDEREEQRPPTTTTTATRTLASSSVPLRESRRRGRSMRFEEI